MTKYHDFTTGNNYLDESIDNYLIYGLEPGGFLTAVLANDLFLAAGRADHWNRPRLAEIAHILYTSMPAGTIGSYEIVNDWIKDKTGRRKHYAERKQKEYTLKILKGQVHEKSFVDPPF